MLKASVGAELPTTNFDPKIIESHAHSAGALLGGRPALSHLHDLGGSFI